MKSGLSIEILDLRHFTAPVFHPVLDAEEALWRQRLHWDYRASIRLLTQYLDSRSLPGYAALESGHVTGYTFCVYEDTKAVIGDVFAPGRDSRGNSREVEETLLIHLFEMLLNSPHIDRVESQLLIQPSGFQAETFREAGFQSFRRQFMVQPLKGGWIVPVTELPANLEMRPWRDEDMSPAAQLICECYNGHPDSAINDQYRSVYGSMRFLNNIVRYAGCGVFSPQASHVIVDRLSRERVALVLSSRVSPESGHITQICVHPRYRRHGLARILLNAAANRFLHQGASEVSLTVTEANSHAIELYQSEGYVRSHYFDAVVWQRGYTA